MNTICSSSKGRVSNRNPREETCAVFRDNELTPGLTEDRSVGCVRRGVLEWMGRKMEDEMTP